MSFKRIALMMGLLASGLAHAAGGVTLTNEVFQEVSVMNAKGITEKQLQPASVITPGTPLAVVITYANKGTEAADKVEIKNPLAKELAFTGEVNAGTAAVDYSVDGGKSWGALTALKVAAAEGATRAAQPADVSAIRFKLAKPVKPGESGKVEFRATLR